jgi:hypothetical protein
MNRALPTAPNERPQTERKRVHLYLTYMRGRAVLNGRVEMSDGLSVVAATPEGLRGRQTSPVCLLFSSLGWPLTNAQQTQCVGRVPSRAATTPDAPILSRFRASAP